MCQNHYYGKLLLFNSFFFFFVKKIESLNCVKHPSLHEKWARIINLDRFFFFFLDESLNRVLPVCIFLIYIYIYIFFLVIIELTKFF